MWVSPEELEVIGQKFISETDAKKQGLSEADGLLSGKGKRMYLMAMSVLAYHSPNRTYRYNAYYSFLNFYKPKS